MKSFPNLDYSDSWIEDATEDELRDANDELQNALDEMDNEEDYCSEEYNRIYDMNVKIVNRISSMWNGPAKREHGWYLPEDD